MPQMKPMNWLILFILINLTLLFMNTMIFFLKNNKIKSFKNKHKLFINWKW